MQPPTHRAQTLKQAKAAYKSRNQVTLTEREKRQIERSIELDKRAWRMKEAEKRRAEAKIKREEKERREREARPSNGMTSQRRCDRFGFVGSQMHLGAFFGGGKMGGEQARRGGTAAGVGSVGTEEEKEDFEDGLDDESMLEAVNETRDAEGQVKKPGDTSAAAAALASLEGRQPRVGEDVPTGRSDLDLFWDDLDSSTQIARDLASDTVGKLEAKTRSPTTSFGSEDFDLSVEDIEAVQTRNEAPSRPNEEKKMMPAPALPMKPPPATRATSLSRPNKPSMPPPPLPAKSRQPARPLVQPKRIVPSPARSGPCFSKQLGFTLAELESFVDDNLQLTQAAPG